MQSENFKVKIHCVIIGVDQKQNKQCVLSTAEDNISIPFIYLQSSNLEKLDEHIVDFLKTLVFTNELELMPQLISLHNKFIENSIGEINSVYGFVIDKTENINNSYWIDFDYFTPNKYSNLLFEVTQKLK